jgi:hypothetical protein
VVPDIDGIGFIPEWVTRNSQHPVTWFSQYHHALHTLWFALLVAAVAFIAAKESWKTAALAFISFHAHLFEDLLGSRGPDGDQWPIPYFSPFLSAHPLSWTGQWALNAWPNFAITIALLVLTLYLAWSRGYSPMEIFSERADKAFVKALRERFPAPKTT